MSLSRIKNNQITDLTIQGGKLANNTVTAGKLEDDLTYGSNLTITGNLTVNGATTTVSTTTTTVEDAIMVLNSDGSGSFTNDVGMYLERGDNTSVFMGYDGSATQFALVETDSAGTVSAINITDYADLRLGGLTADDNITATGTVTGGTVTDGTASISSGAITGATNITGSGTITGGTLTDGTASISSGAITGATSGSFSTTLTATGNITGGNLITSALVSAATVTASGTVTGGTLTDGTASINSGAITGVTTITTSGEATLASAIVSDLTATRVTFAGTSGALVDDADLTFTTGTNTLAATNMTSSGTVTGGTVTDGTASLASGSLTGAVNLTASGTITGGTVTDGTASISSGAVTGVTTITTSGEATLASAIVSDLTATRVTFAGTSGALVDDADLTYTTGTNTLAAGNITTGGTMTATGNVTGGNLITSALVSAADVTASDTVTAGNLTVEASGTIDFNSNKITNVADPTANQDAATKAYVDTQVSGGFTLTDGTTNQTIAGGDTFTVSGTNNEITAVVSATDTLTIGLPDDVTIGNDLTVTGNLTVDGTTTTVNTVTSTLQDPIFQLGRGADNAALSSDDSKDRGIHMFYYDGSEKSAFMGWDNSASKIGFYAEASNTSEVISGTKATLDAAALDASGTVTAGTLTDGTASINSGAVTGVTTITTSGEATLASAIVSDLTATRVTFAGTSGALVDDADLTFTTGTNTLAATNMTSSGTVTGGTVTDGTASITSGAVTGVTTITTSGEATLASAIVSDLTATRVVFAGTSGALVDDADLTFTTGTNTLAAGNITTGGTMTATGNITGGNLLTSALIQGGSLTVLASGTIEMNENVVGNIGTPVASSDAATKGYVDNALSSVFTVTDGTTNQTIADGDTLTFSGTSNEIEVAVSATDTVTIGLPDDVTLGGGLTATTTVTATGNVTGGNLITSALVSAATVTATGTVTGGTLTDGTASINSGAGTGFASLVVDNITIDGDDITTSGSALTINDAGGDMDVRIEGDSDTNLFVTDAGGDQVSIGTATQTTGVKFKVGTTDSAMLPIGTTAQRPTGVVGMLRFNTTTDTLEQYSSADGWEAVGAVTFTVIASETFDGDNSTVAFTLSDSQTTASCIISINGVVQLPTTAYGVSGTTLTFTEAPLSGDKIEVRKITTTTTVTNISSTSGGALVEAPNETEIDITGNLMPSANNTFSIGNATVGWTTVYAEATSAQYADLAEKYEADADYEPGTVVHFGGDKEVTECDTDHCTKVAGVVSTDPAYRMNDGLEAEHTAMVALTGRVPCKVSGPVAKGDMMVSAGNGRARAESDPKVGSVIGKSLENWEGGEGVIEVVVGKH